MRSLLLSLPLMMPICATAAEGQGSSDFSLFASIFQMLGSLAIVLGVIFLFYHLSSKWLKISPAGNGASRYIRVVETRFLAPKKSLLLVEVSGEYLLLSNSGDNLQLVKQIDMVEEIEVVEERASVAQVSAKLFDRLSDLKAAMPSMARVDLLPKKRGEVL